MLCPLDIVISVKPGAVLLGGLEEGSAFYYYPHD